MVRRCEPRWSLPPEMDAVPPPGTMVQLALELKPPFTMRSVPPVEKIPMAVKIRSSSAVSAAR